MAKINGSEKLYLQYLFANEGWRDHYGEAISDLDEARRLVATNNKSAKAQGTPTEFRIMRRWMEEEVVQ